MDREDPAGFLRLLTADALQRARPGHVLLPVSLGLQAVANAFVMLGLLPEPRAEEILTEHRAALERKGFPRTWGATTGELTVRPGAHGYWDARAADREQLGDIPMSVAADWVHCPVSFADLFFTWIKRTPAGIRLRVHGTVRIPAGGARPGGIGPPQAMTEVTVADDTGRSYRLTPAAVSAPPGPAMAGAL
jgi:hypothetical protein